MIYSYRSDWYIYQQPQYLPHLLGYLYDGRYPAKQTGQVRSMANQNADRFPYPALRDDKPAAHHKCYLHQVR